MGNFQNGITLFSAQTLVSKLSGTKIDMRAQTAVLSQKYWSWKFWSAKNFGPGDQNSWKIGPPDHYFLSESLACGTINSYGYICT